MNIYDGTDGPLRIGKYMIRGDRATQQDACKVEYNKETGLLLATVCDGMGGMEGGERASNTATNLIVGRFNNSGPSSLGEAPDWIRGIFISADKAVSELQNERGYPLGAGSTGLIVLADRTGFIEGSVGDSMILLYRNQKIYQLTNMHNYYFQLEKMVEEGVMTQVEADAQSQRGEALISYLGMGGLTLIDVRKSRMQWQAGDTLVICSDGLYKSLDPFQIKAIVEESGGNMQLAAERLCMEAYRLATKKQDNTTVITVGYKVNGG